MAAYLVWSNEHSAWWGPNRCGYTRVIASAGRYSRAEALTIAGTRDGGWHVSKGNPDEIAIPEQDAIDQYASITEAQQRGEQPAPKCANCGKRAVTKYEGEDMCVPCASYCATRDFEEGDMPGGFQ